MVAVELVDLLSLRVALEDEGAERGLPLLVAVAPVPALHHEAHQPAVLLVRCKLDHLAQLELRRRRRRRGVNSGPEDWTEETCSANTESDLRLFW